MECGSYPFNVPTRWSVAIEQSLPLAVQPAARPDHRQQQVQWKQHNKSVLSFVVARSLYCSNDESYVLRRNRWAWRRNCFSRFGFVRKTLPRTSTVASLRLDRSRGYVTHFMFQRSYLVQYLFIFVEFFIGSSNQPGGDDCGDLPVDCTRHNAVYHILHYLTDAQFLVDGNQHLRYGALFLPVILPCTKTNYCLWFFFFFLLSLLMEHLFVTGGPQHGPSALLL